MDKTIQYRLQIQKHSRRSEFIKGGFRMSRDKPRVFRIVTLGEKILPSDLESLLMHQITLNPTKPKTFFAVTECTEEELLREDN